MPTTTAERNHDAAHVTKLDRLLAKLADTDSRIAQRTAARDDAKAQRKAVAEKRARLLADAQPEDLKKYVPGLDEDVRQWDAAIQREDEALTLLTARREDLLQQIRAEQLRLASERQTRGLLEREHLRVGIRADVERIAAQLRDRLAEVERDADALREAGRDILQHGGQTRPVSELAVRISVAELEIIVAACDDYLTADDEPASDDSDD